MTNSSSSPENNKQVVVSFDNNIEILEFHYIMGDNPSVTSGCPIALGSDLVARGIVNIDALERGKKRKSRKRLVMPVPTRAQILLSRGYSIDEIADCTIAMEKVRSERAESNQSQKWDKVNAFSERFFGRVLRKSSSSSSSGSSGGSTNTITHLNGGLLKKMTVAANSA